LNGLSLIYRRSLANVLRNVYPEYNWEPFKFPKVASEHWENLLKDESGKIEYVRYLETELQIENEGDWQHLDKGIFRRIKAPSHWT
jgi:hypothetical protein